MSRQIRNAPVWLELMLSVLVLGCCSSAPNPHVRLFENADDMRGEVLAHTPVGTPIGHAKAVMEENGFECSHFEHKAKRYICCRTDRNLSLLVSRVWNISIQYENDVVTDVHVSTGLVGP